MFNRGFGIGAVDWSFEKGSVTETFPVNFTNGKWVVIGTEDDDNGYRYIVCENGYAGGSWYDVFT